MLYLQLKKKRSPLGFVALMVLIIFSRQIILTKWMNSGPQTTLLESVFGGGLSLSKFRAVRGNPRLKVELRHRLAEDEVSNFLLIFQ